jgi:hypothetical protein
MSRNVSKGVELQIKLRCGRPTCRWEDNNGKFWEELIASFLRQDTGHTENNTSTVCILCSKNVFTESLPSNYKGLSVVGVDIQTYTQHGTRSFLYKVDGPSEDGLLKIRNM